MVEADQLFQLRIRQVSIAWHGFRITNPTIVGIFGSPPHRWPHFLPGISTNASNSSPHYSRGGSARPAASSSLT